MAYNKLSRYRTRVLTTDGKLDSVRYHATDIVINYRGDITLDHGGWRGVTTKRKMNQTAHEFGLRFSVYQKNHDWYVTTQAGTFPYDDRTFSFVAATGVPL